MRKRLSCRHRPGPANFFSCFLFVIRGRERARRRGSAVVFILKRRRMWSRFPLVTVEEVEVERLRRPLFLFLFEAFAQSELPIICCFYFRESTQKTLTHRSRTSKAGEGEMMMRKSGWYPRFQSNLCSRRCRRKGNKKLSKRMRVKTHGHLADGVQKATDSRQNRRRDLFLCDVRLVEVL